MNTAQTNAIFELRREGYAVTVYFPDEIANSSCRDVESVMMEAANAQIHADNEEARKLNMSPLAAYAESLKHSSFGERKTLAEALDYACVLDAGSANPMVVHTAYRVVMNTIANELLALEKKNEE